MGLKEKRIFKMLILIMFILGSVYVMNFGFGKKEETSLNATEDLIIDEINDNVSIDTTRKLVVEEFLNERDVLGTGAFIEDSYKKYPTDEVISTIYNYNSSLDCYDFYNQSKDKSWLEKSKMYASKISPTYTKEYSDEILQYISNLLGDDWAEVQQETIKKERVCDSLTFSQKKEIVNYINDRYDYYDSITGSYSGDTYTDTIWDEISEKFNISSSCTDDVWINAYN